MKRIILTIALVVLGMSLIGCRPYHRYHRRGPHAVIITRPGPRPAPPRHWPRPRAPRPGPRRGHPRH